MSFLLKHNKAIWISSDLCHFLIWMVVHFALTTTFWFASISTSLLHSTTDAKQERLILQKLECKDNFSDVNRMEDWRQIKENKIEDGVDWIINLIVCTYCFVLYFRFLCNLGWLKLSTSEMHTWQNDCLFNPKMILFTSNHVVVNYLFPSFPICVNTHTLFLSSYSYLNRWSFII